MSVCVTILIYFFLIVLHVTLHRVQSLLKMVGGFKEQEKRMATVETEVR